MAKKSNSNFFICKIIKKYIDHCRDTNNEQFMNSDDILIYLKENFPETRNFKTSTLRSKIYKVVNNHTFQTFQIINLY